MSIAALNQAREQERERAMREHVEAHKKHVEAAASAVAPVITSVDPTAGTLQAEEAPPVTNPFLASLQGGAK